jgi:hypothetical protein
MVGLLGQKQTCVSFYEFTTFSTFPALARVRARVTGFVLPRLPRPRRIDRELVSSLSISSSFT